MCLYHLLDLYMDATDAQVSLVVAASLSGLHRPPIARRLGRRLRVIAAQVRFTLNPTVCPGSTPGGFSVVV